MYVFYLRIERFVTTEYGLHALTVPPPPPTATIYLPTNPLHMYLSVEELGN